MLRFIILFLRASRSFLKRSPYSGGGATPRMGLHKLGRYAYSLVDVATSGQTFHVYMKLKGDCVRRPHAQDDNHASNVLVHSASLFRCACVTACSSGH